MKILLTIALLVNTVSAQFELNYLKHFLNGFQKALHKDDSLEFSGTCFDKQTEQSFQEVLDIVSDLTEREDAVGYFFPYLMEVGVRSTQIYQNMKASCPRKEDLMDFCKRS